jgi:hypothetical protein
MWAHEMQINGVQCSFHHLGIPTTETKQEERYSALFDMYTTDSGCESMRIQWHRFGPASPLHRIIKSQPHAAFKVDDLQRATAGMRVLLGPYEPIENFRVAIIEDHGQPIELIQTTLTDDEIWSRARTESILLQKRQDEAASGNRVARFQCLLRKSLEMPPAAGT